MKTYSKDEIETFLRAIDENLGKRANLIIIGGTAAALAYNVSSFTKDIDTVGKLAAIEKAYELAKKSTGLDIPMGPAGVEDGPEGYQERLVAHPISETKYLKVFVPERHDLVLMKVLRGQQNDLDTAAEIHQQNPLSYKTLIELINSEMTNVIGNKRLIKQNFFALIELLFGDAKVKDAEKELKSWEL